MNEFTSSPGGPVAVRIPAALLSAERLTEAQLDGHACVVCGRDYLAELNPTPHMPVGVVDGGQVFACSVPCTAPEGVDELLVGDAAEEVELIRADDLAVVEVVRAAGAAPAVRFSAEGRVDVWTAERAMAAAAALVIVAEREVDEDPEDAERFMGLVLEVVGALLAAARLVRDEIGAAA